MLPGMTVPPVFLGTVGVGGSTVVIGPVGVGLGGAVVEGPMVVVVVPLVVTGGIGGLGGGVSHFPAFRTFGGRQGTVVVGGFVDGGTVVCGG